MENWKQPTISPQWRSLQLPTPKSFETFSLVSASRSSHEWPGRMRSLFASEAVRLELSILSSKTNQFDSLLSKLLDSVSDIRRLLLLSSTTEHSSTARSRDGLPLGSSVRRIDRSLSWISDLPPANRRGSDLIDVLYRRRPRLSRSSSRARLPLLDRKSRISSRDGRASFKGTGCLFGARTLESITHECPCYLGSDGTGEGDVETSKHCRRKFFPLTLPLFDDDSADADSFAVQVL